MTHSGNRQQATALANWHSELSYHEQQLLNIALRDNPKPLGGDLRRNFREGLANPILLRQATVNLLRSRYGITFAYFDGGLMSTLRARSFYSIALA